MREVKFRAWIEDEKYMMSWREIKNHITDLSSIKIKGKEYDFWIDKKFTKEQYTGLKDFFTDHECYENDLIDWYDRHKDKTIRFKVAFKNGGFVGIPIDNPNVNYALSIILCRSMHSDAGKIIGNIHEDSK